MFSPQSADARLPGLSTLGPELLVTTPAQRRLALTRPLLGLLAYALAAYVGWWWLTPLLVFLIFVAVVTVTHDIVHGSLGLTGRQAEWALFVMGAILLESGHAYRLTHTQHHRVFPGDDDPEGNRARMTFWKAILHGPLFLPRLWCWAFQKTRRDRRQRQWLLAEAAWAGAIPIIGVLMWPWSPAVLLYALLAVIGSWSYSLLTVHLPHHDYGETPLAQTHTLRGTIIPALFLELTYHLEHHLYPQVPSHNLPELSRRLDPYFQQAGVEPRNVP